MKTVLQLLVLHKWEIGYHLVILNREGSRGNDDDFESDWSHQVCRVRVRLSLLWRHGSFVYGDTLFLPCFWEWWEDRGDCLREFHFHSHLGVAVKEYRNREISEERRAEEVRFSMIGHLGHLGGACTVPEWNRYKIWWQKILWWLCCA